MVDGNSETGGEVVTTSDRTSESVGAGPETPPPPSHSISTPPPSTPSHSTPTPSRSTSSPEFKSGACGGGPSDADLSLRNQENNASDGGP